MSSLHIFDARVAIPDELERQIRAALSTLWPELEPIDYAKPLIDPAFNPTYFVVCDEGSLVAYTRTICARVAVHGYSMKLYGLGDMLTVPKQRLKGYGSRILRAATAHITADAEADAGILVSEPQLELFYQQCGWSHMPDVRIVTDEGEARFVMMLLLSPRARDACSAIGNAAWPLPGDEW